MIEIEEKHRIRLSALDHIFQGYVCEEGNIYISALPFLSKAGEISFKTASHVVNHYKLQPLFAFTEMKGVDVPLLSLGNMDVLPTIFKRIEELKRKEYSNSRRKIIVKQDYAMDQERATKAFLDAARQMLKLAS